MPGRYNERKKKGASFVSTISEKLHQVLDWAVARQEIAGANLLVLHCGRELCYTQAGFADREKGRPFDRDTICRIYSMTKPVTAVAAMLLVERGLLDLGQSVGDILPAFRNMQVWEEGQKVLARRNILVRDLLSMTSGLSYPGTDDSGREVAEIFEEGDQRLYSDTPLTTMEMAEKIGHCGLAFHPGDKWMYGTSADVLGAVIEAVARIPFGDFLRQEIFQPLGMQDTGFFVTPEKMDRLASVYERSPDGMQLKVTNNLNIPYTMHRQPAFQSGGAGLVSTIDDYAKLAQSLLGHGKPILKPQTVAAMTQAKLLPWQQESAWRSWESLAGYTYGNLCRILIEPGMALLHGWEGEYGWDGWLGTYFCNSPQNDVTVLLFVQRIDAGTMEVTRRLRNVLAAEL